MLHNHAVRSNLIKFLAVLVYKHMFLAVKIVILDQVDNKVP
jgi:hypothetical protein